MKPPTISVVIPAYNYGRFLAKAIDSTLTQDFTDIELVIVNDASTDNTDEVVEQYIRDKRIRYVVNENNLGAVENINKCFSLAKGDTVLLLGADDFLLPGALTILHQQLTQHPESGYAFGYYITADANDRITSIVRHPGHYSLDYSCGRNDLADLLYHDCYIYMGATLFRKSILDKLGHFDTTLQINDKNQFFRATDYDLVLRFAAHGIQSCFVRMPISAFRVHGDQTSVGDNYTKDGTQFMEHLVLLERYITETHYDRLIGYEKRIIQCFIAKLNNFKQHQQEYLALWPKIEARVKNIVQRLEAIPQHYKIPTLANKPLVTIIVPTRDRPIFLLNALQSLLQQTYVHWEAIVINDGGTPIGSLVESVDTQGRIRYHQLQLSQGTPAARNIALSLAQGDVVCYLNEGDCFLPHHLQTVVDALLEHGCDFIYTDSEYVLEEIQGDERREVKRLSPVNYGQFSLEKLQVENYIPINTWAHRRHCLTKIGRFDETLSSSDDWNFLLQITTQFGATHIPIVTTEVHEPIEQADRLSGLKQLSENMNVPIQQRHIDSGNFPTPLLDSAKPKRDNKTPSAIESDRFNPGPLVSVVLTTYNRPRMLADALESVTRQTYQNFEIIVVNDCGDDIESVIKRFNTGNNITYLRLGKNSGPAAARNKALAIVRGEIITYLDDDDLYLPNHLSVITAKLTDCSSDFVFTGSEEVTEKIDADEGRVELQRSRPYQGINYSKERLHVSNFIPTNSWGHRRSLIDKIGLFDESMTSLEDWDLLLRISRHMELVQIDSITSEVHVRQNSRDSLTARENPKDSQLYRLIYDRYDDLGNAEIRTSRAGVLQYFDAEKETGDIAVLSPRQATKAYESVLRCNSKLRMAVLSLDDINYACINLRILSPALTLADKMEIRLALIQGGPDQGKIDHEALEWADIIVVQRGFPTQETMSLLDALFRGPKPVIYELDDLLGSAIPESNPHRNEFIQKQTFIETTIRKADLVTVSTSQLKNEIRALRANCRVLPNLIDDNEWPLCSPNQDSAPVVIGFAGTSTHQEDLSMIEEALVRISEKYQDQVRVVCMGVATAKIASLSGFELRPFLSYQDFPRAFQGLQLDIAIAPLVDNRFNRCKSHLKWLEYSISGIAGVYSDLPTYNQSVDHRVTGLLVKNDVDAWFSALDELVANPKFRYDLALKAQQQVSQDFCMRSGAIEYLNVWRSTLAKDSVSFRELSSSLPVPLSETNLNYQKWRDKTELSEGQAQLMAERMLHHWVEKPSFHLLMLANPGEEVLIADTLESLSIQLYSGWGLSIISAAPIPEALSEAADNIEWIQDDQDPWAALHQTIEETGADWIMFLTPGDSFSANTLFSFADYANIHPEWDMAYCDEDVRNSDGTFVDAKFKPDTNIEFLRSTNYIGAACAIKQTTLLALGGVSNLAYVYWQDMAFKVVETKGEKALGHIPLLLFHTAECTRKQRNVALCNENERVVRYEHFLRSGIAADLTAGLKPDCHHTIYKHSNQPLVSIIIPTKDRADLIIPCIETLLDKTAYQNYEVLIVDNGSIVDDVHDYYDKLQHNHPDKFRVISYDLSFNFSAMNNIAAQQAKGDYLLLLNNDTEVVHENWLDAMMNHAQRSEVGVVGARLIYPDRRLQHAGVILGLGNVASHAHFQQPMDDETSLSESFVDRYVSAVTGACLLIRRQIFDEVGGLNDELFKVAFNDVDLCLKVTERGYKIVWTPFATLIHHDSSSRSSNVKRDETSERFQNEAISLVQRWLPRLGSDPAYNRNLSLMSATAEAETDFIPGWNIDFHDRPRILGFPLDGLGCGYYRVYAPFWALENAAKAEVAFVPEHDKSHCPRIPSLPELARLSPDTLLLQSTLKDNQLDVLELYKQFSTAFKVFDLDDLKTNLPDSNSRKNAMFKDMKYRLKKGLSVCDRLVVSTEPLKEAYGQWIDDVVIVPNRLEKSRWLDLQPAVNDGDKPRVGWAGAQQHHGDLRILIDVIKATHEEIDWVFFGMCLDELRPFIAEEHAFVSPDDYPTKLASLKLDLAVAPLEQNPFNEAKSNLRLLEYGVLGWPVVCTNIFPYRSAPVTTLAENSTLWIDAVMDRIKNRELARSEGENLRQWVIDNWMLEDHLDEWLTALTP